MTDDKQLDFMAKIQAVYDEADVKMNLEVKQAIKSNSLIIKSSN